MKRSELLRRESFSYAPFYRRALAMCIDGLLLIIVQFFINVNVSKDPSQPGPVAAWCNVAFGWLYESLMLSGSGQATIGKKLMRIYVTNEEGSRISFSRATARHFSKYLSAFIFFIGFLWMLFTKKNQTLHDKLAKTVVLTH